MKELKNKSDLTKCFSGVPPRKASYIEDLVLMLPQHIWDNLYSRCVKMEQYSIGKNQLNMPEGRLHCVTDSSCAVLCCAVLLMWNIPFSFIYSFEL